MQNTGNGPGMQSFGPRDLEPSGIDSPRDVHCNSCMYGDGKDAISDCSVPTAGIAFDAVVASIPGAAATTTTTTTTTTSTSTCTSASANMGVWLCPRAKP